MMRDKVHIAFNPDTMSVSDVKACCKTLADVFRHFDAMGRDWTPEQADDFCIRVLQIRDSYVID